MKAFALSLLALGCVVLGAACLAPYVVALVCKPELALPPDWEGICY